MNTSCVLAFLLALVLTACGPQRPPTTANWFVNQFGEHRSKDGAWHVAVSATDHTLELAREWSPNRVPTYRTDSWKAQAGWFVFIEHDTRAWCYDGADFLWLLQVSSNGSSGAYGPRSFPCAVPEQVLARLRDTARKAIVKETP